MGIVYLFSDSVGNIGRGVSTLSIYGQIACVVASFCYGLGNMWARRRLKHLQALQLATGQMLFGTLWTLPAIVLIEQPWRTLAPSTTAVAALGALTLLGTAFAQILYFNLLSQVGATRTAQVTYLLPIFGLFWGWLAGEAITSRVLVALLVVLVGVLIVNGGIGALWSRAQRKPASPNPTTAPR
jgi:drug/metabolite transporter (DMT)-like permease